MHPAASNILSDAAWDRLWSKVDRRGPDECWEWRGCRNERGYGRFYADGRRNSVHRVVASAALGRPLQDGECACHRCDNPPCVNPAHLFVGTHQDNVHDMMRKGRNATGAKTRIGRIRDAVARRQRMAVAAHQWCVGKFAAPPNETIAAVEIVCDVEPSGIEPAPRPDTDDVLDLALMSRALDEAAKDLPPRWRAVFSLRRQGWTLNECGVHLGLTRERVRQIEVLIIGKMQKHRRVAEIVRGRPAPKPVRVQKDAQEWSGASIDAARINARIAAFFARRQASEIGTRRAAISRRIKGTCSFCSDPSHKTSECLHKWRAERRIERRAA